MHAPHLRLLFVLRETILLGRRRLVLLLQWLAALLRVGRRAPSWAGLRRILFPTILLVSACCFLVLLQGERRISFGKAVPRPQF